MKSAKKLLALFLAVIMLFSVMSTGMSAFALEVNVGNNAGEAADKATTTDNVIICVPETIYLKPSKSNSNTVQYFVNNTVDANGNVTLAADAAKTQGAISIYAPGAVSFSFVANGVGGYGDPVIGSMENSNINLSSGYYSNSAISCTINGSGLPATGTGLVEWIVTVNFSDGTSGTYYAYTTVYSPYYYSVGAVAETRYDKSGNFNQVTGWISGLSSASSKSFLLGAHGVNNAGSGESLEGSFMYEPLVDLSYVKWSSVGNAQDTINTEDSGHSYVGGMMLNKNTSTSARSGTGTITVDGSRYTNTNQIPNLYIGADANEAGSKDGSYKHFYAWYTCNISGYYIAEGDKIEDTPSGTWTKWVDIYDDSNGNDSISGVMGTYPNVKNADTLREYVADTGAVRFYYRPSVSIASVKAADAAQYLQLAVQGRCYYSPASDFYANAFVGAKIDVTDKSDLRAAVIKATSLNEQKYTADSWRGSAATIEEFQDALRNAAEVLGNPAASQGNIDSALESLNSMMNSLKVAVTFDAAYNGGVFTDNELVKEYSVVFGTKNSVTLKSGILKYFDAVKEGYEFIGWSHNPDDPSDASLDIVTDVTFGDTLYAHYAKTISVDFYYLSDLAGNTSVMTHEITVYNNENNALDVNVQDADTIGDYQFAGWTGDPESTEGESIGEALTGVTEDAQYYATYKQTVSVILDANGGQSANASVSGDICYNYDLTESTGDATITIPEKEPVKAGHIFKGWDINGKLYQPGDSIVLNKNVTATAVWDIESYEVVFNYKDTDGDDVSVKLNVEYGSSVTAPEVNKYWNNSTMHFKFEGWDKDFDFITGDTVITAKYGYGTMHDNSQEGSHPTCDEAGSVVYTCRECGYSYTYTSGALGHKYVAVDTKDATCEEDGYIIWECSNDSSHTYTEVLPALGHSYEGTVYVAPTCTADGYYISGICNNCGEDLTGKVIPALGHTWEIVTDATCEHPGLKVCLGWTDADGNHCDCDATEVIPQLAHNYVSVVTPPTCEDDGEIVYTCSDCGHSYSSVITATGHVYAIIIVSPSCTSQGYTIKTCPNCGDSEKTNYVPANGHSYNVAVVAATCTAQGYTNHACSVCKHSYKDDYVAALGHDFSIETDVAPGCTTRGYKLHECTKCDSTYKTDYVAATGHNHEFAYTVDPSGTMNGYDLYVCEYCGDQYKETVYSDGRALICYTLYDDDGDYVPNATVVFTNVETGAKITVTADDNGYFTCIMPEGDYTVKISRVGYVDTEGELFVENGVYTLVVPAIPCNDCTCMCHSDNFIGRIYRIIIKLLSIFGFECCPDSDA